MQYDGCTVKYSKVENVVLSFFVLIQLRKKQSGFFK